MPIRINLKELISSDSQEIAIDKINFNFNKLLELGIGELGLTGNTGPVGSAGPIGPEGDTGIRGSSWYVDAASDPNSLSFTDLVIGDFYLSSERISIWRWNGVQWQFIADLSNVVNNYLAESPSPFVRGLGLGSSKDNRFILFSRRGNTQQDIVDDLNLSNSSNNDILFLNNFNEETINTLLLDQVPPGFEYGPSVSPSSSQVATSTLFNSLAAIYADHYNGGTFGRYHLELGSLYELDPDNLNSEPVLSETKHNLKIRFLKDPISSPNFPLTNSLINIARFNLSKPEINAITEIDQNGVYEFITPSFNQEGGTPEREEVTLRLGGAKGLGEYSISGVEPTDGIYLQSGPNRAFTIGVVKSFTQSINETTYSANLTEDVIYFSKSTTPSLSWLFDGKLKIKGNLFVSGTGGFKDGIVSNGIRISITTNLIENSSGSLQIKSISDLNMLVGTNIIIKLTSSNVQLNQPLIFNLDGVEASRIWLEPNSSNPRFATRNQFVISHSVAGKDIVIKTNNTQSTASSDPGRREGGNIFIIPSQKAANTATSTAVSGVVFLERAVQYLDRDRVTLALGSRSNLISESASNPIYIGNEIGVSGDNSPILTNATWLQTGQYFLEKEYDRLITVALPFDMSTNTSGILTLELVMTYYTNKNTAAFEISPYSSGSAWFRESTQYIAVPCAATFIVPAGYLFAIRVRVGSINNTSNLAIYERRFGTQNPYIPRRADVTIAPIP